MWWGHGFNWSWMIFGGLMMLVFWGALIVLVVLAVRGLFGSTQAAGSGGASLSSANTALKILKERYARGEISKDEYEAMKDDLQA